MVRLFLRSFTTKPSVAFKVNGGDKLRNDPSVAIFASCSVVNHSQQVLERRKEIAGAKFISGAIYFGVVHEHNLVNMRVFTQNKKKLLLAAICASRVKSADRLYWVHPINKLRCKLGDHIKLDIKHAKYPERFRKETRLTPAQFDELLLLTEQALQKHAHRKDVVPPRIRLYVTLKYLAHGTCMAQLADSFCLGHSTVSKIVNETTRVIWKILQPIYMPVPTEADWMRIADRFHRRWNFPNCVGALDGKHVLIQRPYKSVDHTTL